MQLLKKKQLQNHQEIIALKYLHQVNSVPQKQREETKPITIKKLEKQGKAGTKILWL